MRQESGIDRREEFELDCIREFSHSGLQLGLNVSREERRERIRAAIFREGKQHTPWRDSPFTYAAAYRLAYHQPLEARQGDSEVVALVRHREMVADLERDERFDDSADAVKDGTPTTIP